MRTHLENGPKRNQQKEKSPSFEEEITVMVAHGREETCISQWTKVQPKLNTKCAFTVVTAGVFKWSYHIDHITVSIKLTQSSPQAWIHAPSQTAVPLYNHEENHLCRIHSVICLKGQNRSPKIKFSHYLLGPVPLKAGWSFFVRTCFCSFAAKQRFSVFLKT